MHACKQCTDVLVEMAKSVSTSVFHIKLKKASSKNTYLEKHAIGLTGISHRDEDRMYLFYSSTSYI